MVTRYQFRGAIHWAAQSSIVFLFLHSGKSEISQFYNKIFIHKQIRSLALLQIQFSLPLNPDAKKPVAFYANNSFLVTLPKIIIFSHLELLLLR
jgi:hypothetical protein